MNQLLFIFFLLPLSIFAQLSITQQAQADSLQIVIKNTQNDTVLVKTLFALDDIIYISDPALDLSLMLKIDSICSSNLTKKLSEKEKLFFLKSKSNALNNLGIIYFEKGEYEISLDFYNKSLKISEETGVKERIAISLNNLAVIYRSLGDFQKSIEISIKSLKMSEEMGDKMGVASSYSNIGIIYKQQENYVTALDYYMKSLKILEEIDYKNGIAICLNNIGNIYHDLENYSKALDFHTKNLKVREEMGSKREVAMSLANIGSVYYDQGFYAKAFDFHTRSLKMNEELDNKSEVAASLNSIGSIYYKEGNFIKALEYGERGLALAQEIKDVNRVKIVTELLWKVNKDIGRPQKSLEMYELHIATRDSILSESNQKAIIEQEYKYEYQKKAAADSVKSAEAVKVKDALIVAEKAETKRQQVISVAVTSGLALVALFLMFVYRRLQITKKQNSVIEAKKKEVEQQKEELTLTYDKLEEVSTEIRDSIAYAELIQQAVLPALKIEDLTQDSFLYFNPKEKVSGDFYWMEQRDQYYGFAVADCTGHGIPGAFISMIGIILLNEIFNSKKIHVPNELLDELSRLVRLTLTNREGYTMKDGMDISFVALDNKTKMLYFAGANNPVWIASRNPEKRINKTMASPISELDGKYIFEIKGDKQPIGDYGNNVKPFTLNTAHLEEGDIFYLFSDGYVDQFGGANNKKYKAKPFRDLLLSLFDEKMERQQVVLNENFQAWKGDYEQIDDVTVIGVRV